MSPEGKSSNKSGKQGFISKEDLDSFLYLCKFIHEGYYNIRITWGEVRRLFSFAVSDDPYKVCQVMQSEGYTESFENSDPFMILRRIDVELDKEREDEVMGKFFEIVTKIPLVYNVALTVYIQKNLIMGIIGSFYDHELNFASTAEERVLISAVTSDLFVSNENVSRLIEKEISEERYEKPDLTPYIENPWFNELILIIKNGYYGNGGFNYIDTLEKAFRVEFTSGILEIIKNGGLLWLILNFKDFVKRDDVDSTIKKFVRKRRDESTINRLYDWLSIGNDFAIGFEFLIGSVEFLPNYNPTQGVYLFIIGSAQLLIRPVISLIRKIHLHKLINRKIRF